MIDATVLLVDDQPNNIKVLLSFLEDRKMDIRIADSGDKALQMLERFHPDLILLDVMMPGIDGFETCRKIQQNERTRDIPVIFMTALSSIEDKIRGFDAGAVDYIVKPFQQAEVLARIQTHILLRQKTLALEKALAEIKTLSSIIPICSYCRKLRDDEGYWQQVEEYISSRTESRFSHGICPDCFEKVSQEDFGWDDK